MSIKFNYYYGKEAEQFAFFRIPKLLFIDPIFSKLSSDAKVLYGILLDRMSLSMKNEWLDEENKVYIIFTIEEIAAIMCCATQKATKILQELDDNKGIGLVEKKRLGLGRPNILYVKNFVIQPSEQESPEKIIRPELLKSQNQNVYQLEDKVVKFYPKEIEKLKIKAQHLKKDIERVEPYKIEELVEFTPSSKFTALWLDGKKYTDKKLAAEFLINKIKSIPKIVDSNQEEIKIGEYRNFELFVQYDRFSSQYEFHLKGDENHHGEFGADEIGNITRMDNVLDRLPQRLEQTLSKLQDTENQLETAKLEIQKKFPQAELLKEKTWRLAEINTLLDMGQNEEPKEQKNPLLEEVKQELIYFINREYGEEHQVEDFDTMFEELNDIGVACTTTPDEKHTIQTSLDLVHYKLNTYVDDTLIGSFQYTYDPMDASDQKELIQIKASIGFWDFNELISVDEEKLKEILGLKIDDEGNFYDPLAKDMDLDGVIDRYDADFRDSNVQNIGDLKKKERPSVMEKLKEYKEQINQGDFIDKKTEYLQDAR